MSVRDVGRYHKLPWGGGQITISHDLAELLPFKNKDKLLAEYDETTKEITIVSL